jgi:hypothetical protein
LVLSAIPTPKTVAVGSISPKVSDPAEPPAWLTVSVVPAMEPMKRTSAALSMLVRMRSKRLTVG